MHRAEDTYRPVKTRTLVLWFAGLLIAIIGGMHVGERISVIPNGPTFNPFPIAQAPEEWESFGGSTADIPILEVVPTPASETPEIVSAMSSSAKGGDVALPTLVSAPTPPQSVRTPAPPAVISEEVPPVRVDRKPNVEVPAPVIHEPVIETPIVEAPVIEPPVVLPPVVEEETDILDPCFREDPECYEDVVIGEPFVETPIVDEVDVLATNP